MNLFKIWNIVGKSDVRWCVNFSVSQYWIVVVETHGRASLQLFYHYNFAMIASVI